MSVQNAQDLKGVPEKFKFNLLNQLLPSLMIYTICYKFNFFCSVHRKSDELYVFTESGVINLDKMSVGVYVVYGKNRVILSTVGDN